MEIITFSLSNIDTLCRLVNATFGSCIPDNYMAVENKIKVSFLSVQVNTSLAVHFRLDLALG